MLCSFSKLWVKMSRKLHVFASNFDRYAHIMHCTVKGSSSILVYGSQSILHQLNVGIFTIAKRNTLDIFNYKSMWHVFVMVCFLFMYTNKIDSWWNLHLDVKMRFLQSLKNRRICVKLTGGPDSPESPFFPFFPLLPGGPGGPASNHNKKCHQWNEENK